MKLVRIALIAVSVAVADWLIKLIAVRAGTDVLFAAAGEPVLTPRTAVALAIAVAAVLFAARTPVASFGAGLLLGGALGNLGELAVIGHVTDFIPFPPGWLASPADVAISIALVLVLGDALRTITVVVTRRGRPAPTRG